MNATLAEILDIFVAMILALVATTITFVIVRKNPKDANDFSFIPTFIISQMVGTITASLWILKGPRFRDQCPFFNSVSNIFELKRD
jgi:hypothetical protein